VEWHIVSLFWISFLRSSFVPAFSSATKLSGTPSTLSNAHYARFNPMPDSGSNFIRNHFLNSAQEKDFAIDGNVAGHRGSSFGRIERSN
jgi:hypothetical protein